MKNFFPHKKKQLGDLVVDYDALYDKHGTLNPHLLAVMIFIIKSLPAAHVVSIHIHCPQHIKQFKQILQLAALERMRKDQKLKLLHLTQASVVSRLKKIICEYVPERSFKINCVLSNESQVLTATDVQRHLQSEQKALVELLHNPKNTNLLLSHDAHLAQKKLLTWFMMSEQRQQLLDSYHAVATYLLDQDDPQVVAWLKQFSFLASEKRKVSDFDALEHACFNHIQSIPNNEFLFLPTKFSYFRYLGAAGLIAQQDKIASDQKQHLDTIIAGLSIYRWVAFQMNNPKKFHFSFYYQALQEWEAKLRNPAIPLEIKASLLRHINAIYLNKIGAAKDKLPEIIQQHAGLLPMQDVALDDSPTAITNITLWLRNSEEPSIPQITRQDDIDWDCITLEDMKIHLVQNIKPLVDEELKYKAQANRTHRFFSTSRSHDVEIDQPTIPENLNEYIKCLLANPQNKVMYIGSRSVRTEAMRAALKNDKDRFDAVFFDSHNKVRSAKHALDPILNKWIIPACMGLVIGSGALWLLTLVFLDGWAAVIPALIGGWLIRMGVGGIASEKWDSWNRIGYIKRLNTRVKELLEVLNHTEDTSILDSIQLIDNTSPLDTSILQLSRRPGL